MAYPGADNYLTCTEYAAGFAISPSFGSCAGALENPFTAHLGLSPFRMLWHSRTRHTSPERYNEWSVSRGRIEMGKS
jgi:hypothetical protein